MKLKIELFGYYDHCYVWRKKEESCEPEDTMVLVKYGGGCIMLWGCFAAGATAALCKTDGIKMKHYVEILRQHLKTSATKLKLGENESSE